MKFLALVSLMVVVFASGRVTASESDEFVRIVDAIANEPLRLTPPRTPAVAVSPSAKQDGSVLTTILTLPIQFHRRVISPQDGDPCTFTPSCSAYALEAIRDDALLGWARASDRLLRCHPGNESEYPLIAGHKHDPISTEQPVRIRPTRATLGALLSLVPGLGQTVGGSPGDGIQAFSTVALFGLGAYAYGRSGERTKAILTGTAAGFFYVGNLYGGARAMGTTAFGAMEHDSW